MASYKALSPKVEVNGETILSVVNGVAAKDFARNILASCGIQEPAPGKWYPQQAWLDAFQKIATNVGPRTLFLIGQQIPASAKWPPGVDTLEKALASVDVAYHMNHRFGEIGNYKFEKVADKKLQMVCDNPYPCEFDKGIITAVARQFRPAGVLQVNVAHDDTKPCREKGANSCTYVISW